jgi:hypothetical protein
MALIYSTLVDALLSAVPELRSTYEKEREYWGEDVLAPHIVFGDILTPYIITLLESGTGSETLSRVFGFLEDLANHAEAPVQEVVALSVCERLADRAEWIESALAYMQPRTRELARQVSNAWRLPSRGVLNE